MKLKILSYILYFIYESWDILMLKFIWFISEISWASIKGIQAVRIYFFVYIKSCQYSMFYTNKMFWTKSQV